MKTHNGLCVQNHGIGGVIVVWDLGEEPAPSMLSPGTANAPCDRQEVKEAL